MGGSTLDDPSVGLAARDLGAAIVAAGYGIICGGLGGVMEAACGGGWESRQAGKGQGPIIGVLPGSDPKEGNAYLDIVLPTGMGHARNVIVALSCAAMVAVDGGSGTLSEIAYAWQFGRPIIAFRGTGGWARELAGRSLDRRRADRIWEADNIDDIVRLLGELTASRPR